MEREKNYERREQSDESAVNSFKSMSLQTDSSNSAANNQRASLRPETDRRRSTADQSGDDDGENCLDDDDELPDSLLQSFSTGTDEKDYDMLSSSSCNDQAGDGAGLTGELKFDFLETASFRHAKFCRKRSDGTRWGNFKWRLF